jgi:hypothetical protein
MNRKTGILLGLSTLVIGSIAFYFLRPHPQKYQAPPPKSIDEILAERSKQATKSLDSPLGQKIRAKKWDEVHQAYHANQSAFEAALIIRGLFVSGEITKFAIKDQDELLTLLLDGIDTLEAVSLRKAALLFSQIERLPTPSHDSKSYLRLKTWLEGSNQPFEKRRMAILKLVMNDASPEPKAVSAFEHLLLSSETFGIVRSDWFQRVDDIRNVIVQKRILDLIANHAKSYGSGDRASALVLLAHHSEDRAPLVRSLLFQQIKEKDTFSYEASLRAISELIKSKSLSSDDLLKLRDYWILIPKTMMNPFMEAKIKEIENLVANSGQ